jgi:hypothetical protein
MPTNPAPYEEQALATRSALGGVDVLATVRNELNDCGQELMVEALSAVSRDCEALCLVLSALNCV